MKALGADLACKVVHAELSIPQLDELVRERVLVDGETFGITALVAE